MNVSCLVAVLLLSAGLIRAEEPVRVSLVSEVKTIQPGRPFYVGLALHHGDGYHTYWQCPGIVGVPTSIDWQLPPGFTAGAIEWPAPERVFMHDVKAQGFERDVVLPILITPPATLTNGVTVRLAGRSCWMACARQCHPGFTDVALELKEGEPSPWRDPRFAAERANAPQTTAVWRASARRQGNKVELSLVPQPGARPFADDASASKVIFFTSDNWIHSDLPQDIRRNSDGSLTMILPINDVYPGEHPPERLRGVVLNPDGWEKDRELRAVSVEPMVASH